MKTKSDPRHEARRLSLNYIYALNQGVKNPSVSFIKQSLKVKKYKKELFLGITDSYQQQNNFLNNLIQPYLASWNNDQLLDIDIILIKQAIIEFLILKITPVKVAVDEAIELAKEFGSEKSGRFINGVLAKVISENLNK